MKYCQRCLYPENHPLNLMFDENGICSGCRVHEEKDQLDWESRFDQLKKLVNEYRSKKRTIHDCIVPVSGARDSYFILHVVKNILGLNPLLVTYNKQYNTRMGIRNLAYLRSLIGSDIMSMTVSPGRAKRVTRESLRQLGSMYWHCLAGQTVFPVQVATKFKIPLIIWGAHQGVDQVGMFSHLDEVEMTRKYRKEHDLMGVEAEDLLRNSQDLTQADIEQYIYPHNKMIEAVGVRGIYLNNYIRWDTKAQHEQMIEKYHYETMIQQRTFDTYNDVDCFHYSGVHDYIKFLKWGYGKVTDHASREIRLGRMGRSEAAALVEKYSFVQPKDLAQLLTWLNMDESVFLGYIDRFRDSRIWAGDAGSGWHLKDSVLNYAYEDKYTADFVRRESWSGFVNAAPKVVVEEKEYLLVGRGWVDGSVGESNLENNLLKGDEVCV